MSTFYAWPLDITTSLPCDELSPQGWSSEPYQMTAQLTRLILFKHAPATCKRIRGIRSLHWTVHQTFSPSEAPFVVNGEEDGVVKICMSEWSLSSQEWSFKWSCEWTVNGESASLCPSSQLKYCSCSQRINYTRKHSRFWFNYGNIGRTNAKWASSYKRRLVPSTISTIYMDNSVLKRYKWRLRHSDKAPCGRAC